MSKTSVPYRLFRSYIRFVTEKLYYRNTKVAGRENVPAAGVPTLIASNHFNSMNDAMAVLLALDDRKPCFIVRADVFSLSAAANKFLRSIGLLPAYRMDYEGVDSMAGNIATFKMSEEALYDGETVTIFPQAGHSEGYWIDRFTGGMAKMVFEAAAMGNFEKEILIVPACNYYRDYRRMRSDMLLRFGEPVKASEYYELYKSKPHTAARELTAEVYGRIEPMMLNIRDKEHYDEIRFILDSEYVPLTASRLGLDNSRIDDNLAVCKHIVSHLQKAVESGDRFFPHVVSLQGQSAAELKAIAQEQRHKAMKEAGVSSVEESDTDQMFSLASHVAQMEKSLHIEDNRFTVNPLPALTIAKVALLLLLSPLALFCLWPSIPCWCIPHWFSRKAKGVMFDGTFMIALNVLFLLPISGIITFFAAASAFGGWIALAYVLLLPAICLFEWYYCHFAHSTFVDICWHRAASKGTLTELAGLRSELFCRIDNIFNHSK